MARQFFLMNRLAHVSARALVSAALAAMLGACAGATPTPSQPQALILSPVDGARFNGAEAINVTVSAVSNAKVQTIIVTLAGREVARRAVTPPEIAVTLNLFVNADQPGRQELSVVVLDAAGVRSSAATINLQIGGLEAPTPVVDAAAPGAPTTTACQLGAEFVNDASIPDGTQIQAGAAFVKTWRMRNTSTCDWPAGYRLQFVQDEPMSKDLTGDPLGAVAQGQEFDASVQLKAPMTKGVYTSTWRLRDNTGTAFGNRVYVAIKVP
jgi:hypothetical protein